MAETFRFELVTPERMLLSEDASQVVIPGTEGEFTVLAGHAPVISSMRPGVIAPLGRREVEGGCVHSQRFEHQGGHGAVIGRAQLQVGESLVASDEAARRREQIRVLKQLAELAGRLHGRESADCGLGSE